MKKIAVASKNPVKIEATRLAFEKMFPNESFDVCGVEVHSGVSNQPMSHDETLAGAMNRIVGLKKEGIDFDFLVGIESGVHEEDGALLESSWAVVESKEGVCGKGRSCSFFLPKEVEVLLKQGKDLSQACDMVFNTKNIGQEKGIIGLLTKDNIIRRDYTVQAVLCALIPFSNRNVHF